MKEAWLEISALIGWISECMDFSNILPGSYFVLKFGWQEGWENDYNKIILLDRPQDFTNKDYCALSEAFKNNLQLQLFEEMQRMFLSAPDEGQVGIQFECFRNFTDWNSLRFPGSILLVPGPGNEL